MNETAEGDLRARTTMTRRDELGTIAAGLNEMLDQLERFNQSLHDRIEEATRDLSLRNAQLAASQSELFALRESLARAERVAALGQVAANVAHQAGTPLNLVSGYVQMIRDDPEDRRSDPLAAADRRCADPAGHARAADDARPRAPAVGVRRSWRSPTSSSASARWPSRGCRARISDCDVSIAEDLPPVKADATQLEMALLNLVTNALDAMPGGGTLSIAATARPDGVRVEVADTGPGFRPRSWTACSIRG